MASSKRYFDDDDVRAILEEETGDIFSSEEDEVDDILFDVSDHEDPTYEPSSSESDSDETTHDRRPIEEVELNIERAIVDQNGQPSTSRSGFTQSRKPSGRPKKKSKPTPQNGTSLSRLLSPEESEFVASWKEGSYTWKTEPIENQGKIPHRNVVHFTPGPVGDAKNAMTPLQCFHLFFSSNMRETTVKFSNEEISKQRANYKKPQNYTKDVTNGELEALLGVLIMAAAKKDNHLSCDVMFDTTRSGERYRAAMTSPRFRFLVNCLRFDDKETRAERVKTDKLAPFSDIWKTFVNNCIINFKPSPYVTIDEQLVGFRGRCPFKMYLPSKPNKYGIKIFMVCDNASSYMFNAEIYTGKSIRPTALLFGQYITMKLIEPLKNSNRNLTCDNWFTSIPLAKQLLTVYKITMVGTIRRDKKELPKPFTNPKFMGRRPESSFFLFSENITAVSYKPTKKNKVVTLISTMHSDKSINNDTNKPEIIMNYNSTKGSVDTLDQLCSNTNCGRKTRRWPLSLFYNMLNVAIHNAYVIYTHNCARNNKTILSKFQFAMLLADQLMFDWMHMRLTQPIPNQLRSMITRCLGIAEPPNENPQTTHLHGERKICAFCPSKKRRMTKSLGEKCKRNICGEHKHQICKDCFM